MSEGRSDREERAEEAAGSEAPEAEAGAAPAPEETSGPAESEAPDTEDAARTEQPATPRRRGSAETGGGRRRAPARRGAQEDVLVRAQARYVRCAPRKARLVVEHIRGKRVDEARAILRHTPRHAARDVLKLLESCVSNAENNHELVADELVVHQAFVDEGPTIRRYRPRALGRATRINKRTSHMTLTLTPRQSKE